VRSNIFRKLPSLISKAVWNVDHHRPIANNGRACLNNTRLIVFVKHTPAAGSKVTRNHFDKAFAARAFAAARSVDIDAGLTGRLQQVGSGRNVNGYIGWLEGNEGHKK
jgi:hypothetical protein